MMLPRARHASCVQRGSSARTSERSIAKAAVVQASSRKLELSLRQSVMTVSQTSKRRWLVVATTISITLLSVNQGSLYQQGIWQPVSVSRVALGMLANAGRSDPSLSAVIKMALA